MDCRLPSAAFLGESCPRKGIRRGKWETSSLLCFAKNRGFGTEPTKELKDVQELKGSSSGKSHAPVLDRQFLKKLESVRRSVHEQKKAEEKKIFLPIDYEAPIDSGQYKVGLGLKVGIGIAVVAFGLVFTLGDSFPSGSDIPSTENSVIKKKLTEKEKSSLMDAIQQFEDTLSKSPKDPTALEGEAVTLVELGEYKRASSLLEKLLKENPENVDAYRLLGEVKYALKDYEGSASAFRSCLSISKSWNFEVLRGLTNALLASNKPDVAVQVLLSSQEDIENFGLKKSIDKSNEADMKIFEIDPIQVDLLLGKAYSDWGHVSDAVAVYDQLISKHPDDFRGYLAKAIILKENGKVGDAERMFIQARFFAPEKAKAFVDRYSRQ